VQSASQSRQSVIVRMYGTFLGSQDLVLHTVLAFAGQHMIVHASLELRWCHQYSPEYLLVSVIVDLLKD
jgi:hypothetical protein